MFSGEYLEKCDKNAAMWRNKSVLCGDWYMVRGWLDMDVVSSDNAEEVNFLDPCYVYIPDMDDLMELIDNQIRACGTEPGDERITIKFRKGRWDIVIRQKEWITIANGASIHEALFNCMFQMAIAVGEQQNKIE